MPFTGPEKDYGRVVLLRSFLAGIAPLEDSRALPTAVVGGGSADDTLVVSVDAEGALHCGPVLSLPPPLLYSLCASFTGIPIGSDDALVVALGADRPQELYLCHFGAPVSGRLSVALLAELEGTSETSTSPIPSRPMLWQAPCARSISLPVQAAGPRSLTVTVAARLP